MRDLVERHYVMDPEKHILIPSGLQLANGLTVLIRDPRLRQSVGNDMKRSERLRALRSNRWCTITGLKIEQASHGSYRASFTGVYGDGTSVKRRYDIRESWICKKDSLPRARAILKMKWERECKLYLG